MRNRATLSTAFPLAGTDSKEEQKLVRPDEFKKHGFHFISIDDIRIYKKP